MIYSTDAELFAAALAQISVAVVQRTADDIPVYMDCGIIEKFTPCTVTINGTCYDRCETELRIESAG